MGNLNTKMTALADEIRELSGTTTTKSIDTMTSDVNTANTEISEQTDLIEQIATALEGKASGSGGVTLPELSNPASASDILSDKEAIDGDGNVITGTIVTKTSSNLTASDAVVTVPAGYYATSSTKSVSTATQATPSISVSSSGLITASATQSAGYVSAGTKSGTKQLTTKGATTYTPSTSNQTIASGTYLTGTQTIKGDSNLVADNIKSGTSIFGVTGTYEGSGSSGGSSFETCTVTFVNNSEEMYDIYGVWYDSGSIHSYPETVLDCISKTITAIKNSFFVIPTTYNVSASAGNVDNYSVSGAVIVTVGDNESITVTISG